MSINVQRYKEAKNKTNMVVALAEENDMTIAEVIAELLEAKVPYQNFTRTHCAELRQAQKILQEKGVKMATTTTKSLKEEVENLKAELEQVRETGESYDFINEINKRFDVNLENSTDLIVWVEENYRNASKYAKEVEQLKEENALDEKRIKVLTETLDDLNDEINLEDIIKEKFDYNVENANDIICLIEKLRNEVEQWKTEYNQADAELVEALHSKPDADAHAQERIKVYERYILNTIFENGRDHHDM